MDIGDNRLFYCSECGYFIDDIYDGNSRNDDAETYIDMTAINYCPHCGSKIEED